MQNQTLTVAIGNHRFEIEHQTMMGNLNEFWDCGNAYRTQKGLPPKLLANWLRSVDTAEYVAVVEKDLFGFKSVVTTQLVSINSALFIGRRRVGQIRALCRRRRFNPLHPINRVETRDW